MKEKFELIKKTYKEFYDSLLRKGELLVRDTEKGIWGITTADDAFAFFKDIKLDRYKNFIDLGSGDGIVVMIASLFTKATGIEFDEELHKKAVEIKERLELDVNLKCKDFFEEDLSKYDIIFINPDQGFHKGLEDKLIKELKGRLFVHQKIFQPRFLKKGKTYWINQTPIIEYSNP